MDWKKYFRFAPRANRAEFAFIGAVWQLLCVLSLGVQILNISSERSFSVAAALWGLLLWLLQLLLGVLTTWLSLASFSRRLHDMNGSAWWIAAYLIAVTVLSLLFPQIWWVFTVLGSLVWIFLCFKQGSPDVNRFGEVPPLCPKGEKLLGLLAALGLLFALGQAFCSHYVLLPRALTATQQVQNFK